MEKTKRLVPSLCHFTRISRAAAVSGHNTAGAIQYAPVAFSTTDCATMLLSIPTRADTCSTVFAVSSRIVVLNEDRTVLRTISTVS